MSGWCPMVHCAGQVMTQQIKASFCRVQCWAERGVSRLAPVATSGGVCDPGPSTCSVVSQPPRDTVITLLLHIYIYTDI